MDILKKILKVILLVITALSVPAIGLFGTMAFQALTTRNVGAVLVGAIFLVYFLIAAAINLILLIWASFWEIHRFWNLVLGLETGGLLLYAALNLPFSEISDYRPMLISAVLALIYGLLTVGFLRRAYAKFRPSYKQV